MVIKIIHRLLGLSTVWSSPKYSIHSTSFSENVTLGRISSWETIRRTVYNAIFLQFIIFLSVILYITTTYTCSFLP